MKTTLSITCAASLFLFSFALPGDQLRFAVKEKTKLSKVFEDKTTLHSTSLSATVDGNDLGTPEMKLTFEESTHVEVSDEYGALKDGRPTKVTRSYDKLNGTSLQKLELPDGMEAEGNGDEKKDRSSELEGKTIVFKLSDDGEGYKADFPDGKGDPDLLKRLEEDMDLRGFLPSGEVVADKSWEIDPKIFNSVLGAPGGDLKIKVKDDKDDDSGLEQQFADNVKGKGKGTYKGTRDVDGQKCAVIALEAELTTDAKEDKSGEGAHAGKRAVSLEFSVEGEMLWDIDAGHFRKCTLSSKVKMTMKDQLSIDAEDGKHELEQTAEFEGEAEFTGEIGG